jgi:hypothetical protein
MTAIEFITVGIAAAAMVARIAMFLPRMNKVEQKQAA